MSKRMRSSPRERPQSGDSADRLLAGRTKLVSVSRDRTGMLWDVTGGKMISLSTATAASCRPRRLAGRQDLASAGADKRILLYDVPADAKPQELRDAPRSKATAGRSRGG